MIPLLMDYDTSTGGLFVPDSTIRPLVSVSALTLFILFAIFSIGIYDF
jgi:hypothetical protein